MPLTEPALEGVKFFAPHVVRFIPSPARKPPKKPISLNVSYACRYESAGLKRAS
jgi:hypothetical protein